jgi:Tol biopolymer transport system component
VSGTTSEETPRLSADDLTLYFASNRTGTKGNLDIWSVTRGAVGGAWGPPVNLTEVNTSANEKWFQPCGKAGRYMMIVTNGANGNDLAEGVLGSGTAPVVAPTLNSASSETGTFLTQDCLTIYFASARGAKTAIFTSHRNAVTDAWPPPTVDTDFATGGNEQDPWMSPDQRTFIFASDAGGNNDIYISTR